jgi:hypothetical protein
LIDFLRAEKRGQFAAPDVVQRLVEPLDRERRIT